MIVNVQAVYEDGHLRLLEPVNLQNGQQVSISIQTKPESDEAIRAALGDLVQWPNPHDDRYAEVEALAEEIDRAFSVGSRPLSEMIIEDRGEI